MKSLYARINTVETKEFMKFTCVIREARKEAEGPVSTGLSVCPLGSTTKRKI